MSKSCGDTALVVPTDQATDVSPKAFAGFATAHRAHISIALPYPAVATG